MKEALLQDGSSKTVLGMYFKEASPWFVEEAKSAILLLERKQLADQMQNLWIPKHRLHGGSERLSINAYPIPFPSVVELGKIWPLISEEKVTIKVRSGVATFSLDCFGFVDWLDVTDVPGLHNDLCRYFDFDSGPEPQADFDH